MIAITTDYISLWFLFAFPQWLGRDFPGSLAGRESACNVEDLGSIPGLERSPGEGDGYQLQYPGLENSMDCIGSDMTNFSLSLSVIKDVEHFFMYLLAICISSLKKNVYSDTLLIF